jgi:hypothetical protein
LFWAAGSHLKDPASAVRNDSGLFAQPVAVTEGGRTVDNSAGMLLASARAVLRLGQVRPKRPEMQLSAGLGVINRFGSAWRNRTGTTDLAGVVGIAGRYPLGRDIPINVRIEIEDYISRAQFTASAGGRTSAGRNHDTLWSVGFEIPYERCGA